MELTSTSSGDIQTIKVNEARIDAAVAIQFKDAVRAQTDAAAKRVVLDLSEVAFIDSSGLGAIVAAMKQMDDGQKLDLAGLTPAVDKVFRLTRMDTVFDIYESTDTAMLAKTGT